MDLFSFLGWWICNFPLNKQQFLYLTFQFNTIAGWWQRMNFTPVMFLVFLQVLQHQGWGETKSSLWVHLQRKGRAEVCSFWEGPCTGFSLQRSHYNLKQSHSCHIWSPHTANAHYPKWRTLTFIKPFLKPASGRHYVLPRFSLVQFQAGNQQRHLLTSFLCTMQNSNV